MRVLRQPTEQPGWYALMPVLRADGFHGLAIDFRHAGHPDAVMQVTVSPCDLGDGNVGVLVEPTWRIFDPDARYPCTLFSARAEIQAPLHVACPADDTWGIDDAVTGFAGLIADRGWDAFSHPAFDGIFTPELLCQMFAWDGQPFDWDEE